MQYRVIHSKNRKAERTKRPCSKSKAIRIAERMVRRFGGKATTHIIYNSHGDLSFPEFTVTE